MQKARAGALLAAATVWAVEAMVTGCGTQTGPVVDLGYATYQGSYNDTYDLNIWKSIRYAAAPVDKLRWQAPQPPPPSRPGVTPAVDQPPLCPQSGAFGTPEIYGFNSAPGNEDCLYLNVYAASGAEKLPVLVWIRKSSPSASIARSPWWHEADSGPSDVDGGGYSLFGATYDPSAWMNTNNNSFVTVEIQYRLGAFGFLASSDVKEGGALNAGLLDQRFALEWVQEHIAKFGGDPSRVTIGGKSSGAGSVMYLAMAYGGNDSHLFNNVFASSPYTPAIRHYSDSAPTRTYNKFVQLAGCGERSPERHNHPSAFDCLVAADTKLLQNASGTIATTQGYYGSFAFLPVIDDGFIQDRPAKQLFKGRVSGKHLLVGSNADEGIPLTNPKVKTREQYDSFVSNQFPSLNKDDVSLLDAIYNVSEAQPGNDGIQRIVFYIAAESTFHCPAQWLAEAYSNGSRQAWKYQYSVTPAYHGADLSAYFPIGDSVPNADFSRALQKMLGNFIVNDSPVISVADATANQPGADVPIEGNNGRGTGDIHWPRYTAKKPLQMDLNTTGGRLSLKTVTEDFSYHVRTGDGIVNNFRLLDGLSAEGGRGERCDFWRRVAL